MIHTLFTFVYHNLHTSIDTMVIDTMSQIIEKATNYDTTTNSILFDSPIFLKFLLPILLMVLGWILKALFDKYISIRPRLILELGDPLYSQRLIGYDVEPKLTWRFECILKNNSKFDAYDIELLEYKPSSEDQLIITNRQELDRVFILNNHILSNKTLSFEIKKTIVIPHEKLLIVDRIENETIMTPGIKIPNPQTTLMPLELNTIRLAVKYKNEKGKVFYTKFTRLNKSETNKIKTLKPWLFHGTVK